MVPGSTLPIDETPVRAMKDSETLFPAEKGSFYMQNRYVMGRHERWIALPSAPLAPLTFLDGSAFVARWTDFDITPQYFEFWVGQPVYSTWSGIRGRDSRSHEP